MKIRDLLVRGIAGHVSPALQGALARAGRQDLATLVSRWTVVLVGSAWLVEQIGSHGERPSVEELRAMCWSLGAELEEMKEPAAAVFFSLAEGPAEGLELQGLIARIDSAMEDVSTDRGLEAAEKMAVVWRFLRSFEVVEQKGGDAK